MDPQMGCKKSSEVAFEVSEVGITWMVCLLAILTYVEASNRKSHHRGLNK